MAPTSQPSSSADAHLLPTGTVTFAFTDIEGSAQRWDRDRAAMQGALRRHDDLLRSAVENQNGHVFKTMGDACCSVFARPEDAIAAMADAQRVVAAEDFSAVDGLRVRAAIHTGTSDERDGDYFGPAVNRVARLMSIGHGGQILVSGATRELAHSDLPAGTTLVDLGSQRLRDLTDPEHVWQLSIGGLQSEFPPLRSLNAFPNNLPIQRTSFVGRESDVAAVKKLLGRHRLLTLAGSGGVGKTRLALQVGAALLDRYPDGVWVVDFAPITDPELVSSVIAQVLGMSQQEGRRIDESIPLWLKRKKLLLIFDNCEHIVDIAASLADAILATAQDVRILTTSRQPLDVGGEALHRLPSLSVPTEAVGLRMDEALRYGAIALFVDRAQTADTRFTLTNDTAPVVAEICRRLDGIPLAIELVAARVKVLSIPNLAHRLNERFRLLTGGSRSALPRQKTLSALIDWSYDLLTVQEQLLFTRLGIFAGEFGLEAVSAVCSGAGLDEIESFDLLTSLTDKSLVVADTSGERERYRLLESTRAYAFEKLALDERARLARRHGEYFRSQADAARERFGTGSTFAWVAGVELELDDYRAALAWGLTQSNDAVVGGAIAGALSALWNGGGLGVEGRYWIGLALERVSDAEQPRIAARLWYALTPLSYGTRKRDAAERAMQLYASVGDVHWAANARVEFAWGLYQMGRLDEAGDAIARALAALRTCGDQWGVAGGLNIQAAIALNSGNRHSARELFAQALATYKALGNEIEAAVVLGNMAELEFGEGRPEEALRLGAEALEINVCGKNTESIALAHVNGAAYRIALADLTGARASAREGLRWSRQAGVQLTIAISLQHLAVLAGLGGNSRSAAELLGYVDAQYRELGLEREPTEQSGYDTLQAALHDTLSGDEIAKLAAQGAAWSEDRAVEEALKV